MWVNKSGSNPMLATRKMTSETMTSTNVKPVSLLTVIIVSSSLFNTDPLHNK
jgi:hypothetical protein